MSKPSTSGRDTLRVPKPGRTQASPAARALHDFDATLELPCVMTPGQGAMAAAPFQLTILREGTVQGRQLSVHADLVIGRSPACGVTLDDPAVSRLHARIHEGVLIDEQSANGCQVNGVTVERQELANGDVIQVGSHELVFHRAEGAIPSFDEAPAAEESEVGHVALGERTLRTTDTASRQRIPELELPRRGYLFVSGDSSKMQRKALQMTVTRDSFVIGGAADSDLPLSGFRMPNVAAVIVRGPLGFSVAGFSRWPLKVELNGEPLDEPMPFKEADELSIGGLKLTFRIGS